MLPMDCQRFAQQVPELPRAARCGGTRLLPSVDRRRAKPSRDPAQRALSRGSHKHPGTQSREEPTDVFDSTQNRVPGPVPGFVREAGGACRRQRGPHPHRSGRPSLHSGLHAASTAASTATSNPASKAEAGAKIKPKLARQLDAKGKASFWVRFDQADLSSAAKIGDWTERGQAVYDALKAAASEHQKDTRELLDGEDATYQAFWATNAIRVDAGDSALAMKIARGSDVVALYPTFDYRLEKPIRGKPLHDVDAVEWGIANINADDVWDQFGVDGEGITVASIDTGTQFDHPALVNQYRGNNGDGTFDHNYNWFDAAGSCPDAPCDNDVHGTHTMGTMVGDDGGENQIGVAPGAKWIEANGCCPSDAALIASGEWMLAPTDLAGENPDVSKRPNIINNSWGTPPSNDPFMEDIELAWAASGMWGQWSNGNSGPDCETSGSPGSRIINYSSGAYDINNEIAGFSSRGSGQDGEIKPNISAPGVNVRSSEPGNTYGALNGTSMASPHVAGAIALLWSAAPSLIGDIAGTKALLDETAIDTDDTSCGGTADDNNVFGEGRLDALALVSAAPVGDTGTLAGTVTDSATGDPLADATVEITGDFNRTVTTGEDGSYSVRLVAGDYTATASLFGYDTESADVTVGSEETTTQDFALTVTPSVTLSGTVTDGSGHGWPLYAAVDVEGPGADVYTDPISGEYSVSLPSNATYTLTVEPQYAGYTPLALDVTIGDSDATQDFAPEVDSATCTAVGYQLNTEGVTEDFNAAALPDGWTIEDNLDNDEVWRFDDPGERGNLTGGDGAFAVVDSDFYGTDGVQDTSLVTPVMDLSTLTDPVVSFQQDYRSLGDIADVDLSIDGGATWTTALHQTTEARGPRQDVVQLPAAAGQAAVQVRFHFYDAAFGWWWEIDDVFVGNRTCEPIRGGLVVGNVFDGDSTTGINNATVTSVDQPAESTKTVATPDDDALSDGFYWLFSSVTGSHAFKAEASHYTAATTQVDVDRDDATRADFHLASGHLTVTPTSLAATAKLGGNQKSRSFVVTNDGEAPVNAEFGEKGGGFVMQKADGSTVGRKAMLAAKGAPLKLVRGTFSPLSQAASSGHGQAKAPDAPAPHEDPWTTVADYPENTMDAGATTIDGLLYSFGGTSGGDIVSSAYVYDPAATAWSPIADLPEGLENPAVAAIDGTIYISGGWLPDGAPSTSTLAYDPSSDSYSRGVRPTRGGRRFRTSGARRPHVPGRRMPRRVWSQRRPGLRPSRRQLVAGGGLPGGHLARWLRGDRRAALLRWRHGGRVDLDPRVRLRPGGRQLVASGRPPGRPVGHGLHRSRRDAPGVWWGDGRLQHGHQPGLRLRPGCRLVDLAAELEQCPLPERQCVRSLQDRRYPWWVQPGA